MLVSRLRVLIDFFTVRVRNVCPRHVFAIRDVHANGRWMAAMMRCSMLRQTFSRPRWHKQEEDFSYTATSVAWELIPFSAL